MPATRRTTPQRTLTALLLAVLAAAPVLAEQPTAAPASPPAPTATPAEAHPNLAERLVDLAVETLRSDVVSTSQYRQAGALLEAASRLNPTEPRYHRLRYEAMLQAGDVDAAIQSLVAYARLDTTDLQAQLRLVELYAQRMETAEAKLNYLRKDLLGTPTIPAEVRSHAALLAARVLLERGERKAGAALAEEACRLSPLNPEAQQLRFELTGRDGTAVERVNGLLSVVRASPTDPAAVSAVADELSIAGLDESVVWYDAAIRAYQASGAVPPREKVINFAARLLMSGNPRDAAALSTRVLAADPNDYSAHLIRLSHDRLHGDPGSTIIHRSVARTLLMNRFLEAARAAGDVTATTRPADTVQPFRIPDPVATAVRVDGTGDNELRRAFAVACADLAFFHLFFENTPQPAADLIEALRRFLPPDSPTLVRLEGWRFLVMGRDAEARVKLSAVAERDPLAALGLARLDLASAGEDPAALQAAQARARKLRADNPHGVFGALVYAELSPKNIPLVLPTTSEQIKANLAGFPADLLRIISAPEQFYFLRAEPLDATLGYSMPMLVRVTLVNTSAFDLTLGSQGAIRPDLWFDAQVRGIRPAAFPATAFDRLAGPVILKPKQAASRVVRLDQGRLLVYLRSNPYTAIPVTGSVITNPSSDGDNVRPGPGGYQVQLTKFINQAAIPIAREEQRQALLQGLSTADPAIRAPLIDAAVVNYSVVKNNATAEFRDVPVRIRAVLDDLFADPEPTARSWGTFWGLILIDPANRLERAKRSLEDPYWLTRLLALAGSRGAGAEVLKTLATSLTNDPDPTVRRFAQANLDEAEDALATTRPGAR